MDEARRYRSLLIIFIIILLLHSIILWIVFITSFDHSLSTDSHLQPSKQAEEQKNNPILNPNTWKALQAKPSAPVLFKNVQTSTDSSADIAAVASAEPKIDPKHEASPEKKSEKFTLEKSLITDAQGRVPLSVQQEKSEQSADTNFISTPKTSQASQTEKNQTQKTTPPAQPKKFSFNTLAQGFAQHMHDQGSDQYTMRGSEKGAATAHQLKYAQYGSKICNTITNTFITNKRKLLFASQTKNDAIIKLVINKDGTLKEATVLKSSTVPSVDISLIALIKEAAQGFPPLPDFFAMNHFPLVITFNNAMQFIEHPEQSYWSL